MHFQPGGSSLSKVFFMILTLPATAGTARVLGNERLLPVELQRYYLPLYPTVGVDGEFTSFARRWEETLAGRGQAYTSDTSLVSRIVSAAYSEHPSECPSDAVVEALVN